MSRAAATPIIPAPTIATATTTAACIAATTGMVMPTTATIRGTGTTRDFMDGPTIRGRRRFTGALVHGVGEERRGGASTAAGSRLIPFMPGRRSGSPTT